MTRKKKSAAPLTGHRGQLPEWREIARQPVPGAVRVMMGQRGMMYVQTLEETMMARNIMGVVESRSHFRWTMPIYAHDRPDLAVYMRVMLTVAPELERACLAAEAVHAMKRTASRGKA